jgi:hypothetical protein
VVVGIIIFSSFLDGTKPVGRIVGGEMGCTVERKENGILKKLAAARCMELYPGDILFKKDGIDSVQVDFLPYAKAVAKGQNAMIITFNPPVNKHSIFTKIKEFIGFVKPKFCPIEGVTKGSEVALSINLPGENATVIPRQRIIFSNCRHAQVIVFKDNCGKEIFRRTIEKKDISLTPGDIGMVPSGIYTWEMVDGKKVLYNSKIKLLSKKESNRIREALRKIDAEEISTDEKRMKQATYLQFISDLYPEAVNLYWLSYQLLKDVNTQNEKIRELAEHFIYRCLARFKGGVGITELDFDGLYSSGCLVAIEWKKEQEKRYVSPNVSFYEGEDIRIHFQTNFDGYAVVLYEDEGGSQLVFPVQGSGYRVKQKIDWHSYLCEFDENAGKENFIFILSEKPIEEMEQQKNLNDLIKRAQKEGIELNVGFIGTKAFVTISQKQLEGLAWFRLALKNLGKE